VNVRLVKAENFNISDGVWEGFFFEILASSFRWSGFGDPTKATMRFPLLFVNPSMMQSFL